MISVVVGRAGRSAGRGSAGVRAHWNSRTQSWLDVIRGNCSWHAVQPENKKAAHQGRGSRINAQTASSRSRKGAAAATQEMMGGRIDLMFDNMSAARAHIETGRVKALAVSPAKRVPQLQQVPTVNESGVTKFEGESWMGMFAPSGTPRATVDALRGVFEQVLRDADFKSRIEAGGGRLMTVSPREQQTFVRGEIERWGALIRKHGVSGE